MDQYIHLIGFIILHCIIFDYIVNGVSNNLIYWNVSVS
jgi:hypothetical protein